MPPYWDRHSLGSYELGCEVFSRNGPKWSSAPQGSLDFTWSDS